MQLKLCFILGETDYPSFSAFKVAILSDLFSWVNPNIFYCIVQSIHSILDQNQLITHQLSA